MRVCVRTGLLCTWNRFRMTPDRILELNPDMAARISSPSEMVLVCSSKRLGKGGREAGDMEKAGGGRGTRGRRERD